jgi:hypothetical protein
VVEAREVENDAWTESTLTWNIAQDNHPIGGIIDTQTILSTDTYHWESWDVTPWVRSQWPGDKIVSIAMRGQSEDDNSKCSVWWYTKDDLYYPDWHPYLEVSWRAPPAPPVGGTVRPVNKLALLAPWIILGALIAIVGASVAVYWRRR